MTFQTSPIYLHLLHTQLDVQHKVTKLEKNIELFIHNI
jgi:hypothetical protein